jgi:radical SAM superfamily enzyme YgiQ (UPF0313 family)
MVSKKIIEKLDLLLAQERGTIHKDPGGRVSVCLVYPNTYFVGMSNLGFQGIYTLLNARSDVVCERAFLPDEEDLGEYARTGTEILSLESKRPLNAFPIVAFSVSFENDYPNIARILAMAKIPCRAAERNRHHPLLVMGGACAFFNPEPVAAFFDVCFIGEAEEAINPFFDLYRESTERHEFFRRASDMPGVYVPSLYREVYDAAGLLAARTVNAGAPVTIRRQHVADLAVSPLRPSIATAETEFSEMYLTEAMRGCPWSCRFCVAGYVYKPARRKPLEVLKAEVGAVRGTVRRVGVIGPSLTDYPSIGELLRMEGVNFSITSLRASPTSAALVRFLRGHRSVSIAPEAGTERLRRVIDKRITEADILETARLVLSEEIETLRLYFMIGLPTESDEDIDGIIDVVKTIRSVSARGGIVLTVSTFVPKPFTPFQWHPMVRPDVVKRRLKAIKKALQEVRGVKVFHDVLKYAYMQGLFARGDRRVSRVIERLDTPADWEAASRSAGLDPERELFRQREFSDPLPWDFIDGTMMKQRLWEEYQKAMAGAAA